MVVVGSFSRGARPHQLVLTGRDCPLYPSPSQVWRQKSCQPRGGSRGSNKGNTCCFFQGSKRRGKGNVGNWKGPSARGHFQFSLCSPSELQVVRRQIIPTLAGALLPRTNKKRFQVESLSRMESPLPPLPFLLFYPSFQSSDCFSPGSDRILPPPFPRSPPSFPLDPSHVFLAAIYSAWAT